MKEERIGKVKHYYPETQAALLELEGNLKKGDILHIKGAQTDLVDRAESLMKGDDPVDQAKAGDEVGVKVREVVHDNSEVYVIRD